MKILQKTTATVGQIVKDLELVVAKEPDILLDYSNEDGNDMFVKGVKLGEGIAILETTGDEERAASAEELLAMFRKLDTSLGVVLHDLWEMLNFVPYPDGSIIRYDDEDGYCLFTLGGDVRLITTQQIEAAVKKIDDEGLLDYQVVTELPHESGLRIYRANCLRERYGKLCLCYVEDEEKDNITVGELLEEFPYCAEFWIEIGGDYYTVDINGKGIFCSVARTSSKSFFTIHVGEKVFDPMDIWE